MGDVGAARPARPGRRPQHAAPRPTRWIGWVIFGGLTMVMLGIFQLVEGLVALFKHGYYLVAPSHLVVHLSYPAWGWLHIAIGVVLLVTGFGVMVGQLWARVLGIIFAAVSAIVNLAFIGAYPIWSIIIIALDVVVIYAIAVHGREVKYS
ncbi:MAG TPA: hypothetical protein VH641_07350 [Streptosporangiaceae bacterium]|jgi:hypothetical protein